MKQQMIRAPHLIGALLMALTGCAATAQGQQAVSRPTTARTLRVVPVAGRILFADGRSGTFRGTLRILRCVDAGVTSGASANGAVAAVGATGLLTGTLTDFNGVSVRLRSVPVDVPIDVRTGQTGSVPLFAALQSGPLPAAGTGNIIDPLTGVKQGAGNLVGAGSGNIVGPLSEVNQGIGMLTRPGAGNIVGGLAGTNWAAGPLTSAGSGNIVGPLSSGGQTRISVVGAGSGNRLSGAMAQGGPARATLPTGANGQIIGPLSRGGQSMTALPEGRVGVTIGGIDLDMAGAVLSTNPISVPLDARDGSRPLRLLIGNLTNDLMDPSVPANRMMVPNLLNRIAGQLR